VIPAGIPLALALLLATPEPLSYRFDQVQRSVQRWPGGDPRRAVAAAAGDAARSGDSVRTGWFSRTVLSVPGWNARFEVYSGSRVRLAAEQPGVLLEVQQGRIAAFFDAVADGGRRERKVAVPGALLAVRGTRYGVEVDAKGRSTLAVFEGVVEVQPAGSQQAVFPVRAGQWTDFAPGMEPRIQPMEGLDADAWSQGARPDTAMGPGHRVPGHGPNHPHPGLGPPWLR
jgi:hypothetical protein